MKHGHVSPLPGGIRARCGGPSICSVCQREQAELKGKPKIKVYVHNTEDWIGEHGFVVVGISVGFDAILYNSADYSRNFEDWTEIGEL